MKALFSHYKKLHLWLLANLALLSAFLLARRSRGAMNALTEGFTNPLRRMLGRLCECVPFSVSEGLYVLAAMGFLAFLVLGVRAVVRSRHRSGTVYALVLGLGNAVLTVYVLFCLLWGANYYADSFTDKSGIDVRPVAVDDLERVTRQFAALVNEYAGDIPRAADGAFAGDRAEILAYAPKIYENLYEEFPFLEMTDVPPKTMRFSRVMSAMGFTGFYFPFTGECNVNVDFPAATLPTTVAHELSHRRGIASEQECNFLAVLACLRCGDAAYRYAGALSGYIYLANALYSADAERWRAVRETLDERVVADLRASGAYWAQFEGLADTVSNAVYDGFLKSYGTIEPTMGMKALDVMVWAGLIAFILISIYLLIYYRLAGFVAILSLLGQVAGSLACVSGYFGFLNSFTLTLPGIAGVILSIGMGVDANIITAERIKEEVRAGRTIDGAIQIGSKNSFWAIFDGNITVIIVAVVLMGVFGPPDGFWGTILKPVLMWFPAATTGSIYSFGYTLMVGVLLNFVMGVLASRLMVMSLSNFKIFQNKKLYGGEQA